MSVKFSRLFTLAKTNFFIYFWYLHDCPFKISISKRNYFYLLHHKQLEILWIFGISLPPHSKPSLSPPPHVFFWEKTSFWTIKAYKTIVTLKNVLQTFKLMKPKIATYHQKCYVTGSLWITPRCFPLTKSFKVHISNFIYCDIDCINMGQFLSIRGKYNGVIFIKV